MMTLKEELILPWSCTLGKKSHINIVGKVLFSPILIIVCLTWNLLELFFGVRQEPNED